MDHLEEFQKGIARLDQILAGLKDNDEGSISEARVISHALIQIISAERLEYFITEILNNFETRVRRLRS